MINEITSNLLETADKTNHQQHQTRSTDDGLRHEDAETQCNHPDQDKNIE